MSFEKFRQLFDTERPQLVWEWIEADLETPVSAYLKLCSDEPYSFLLESVEGGKVLGRYSAIGIQPDLLWRCQNNQVSISKNGGHWDNQNVPSPLISLKSFIKDCRIDIPEESLPPMTTSGLFGYLGYDMIRFVEDIPDNNPDELGLPDALMMRPTVMVVFDNVKNMMCVSTPVREHKENTQHTAQEVYQAALQRIESIKNSLEKNKPEQKNREESNLTLPLEITSNTTREEYHGVVKKAVEYIHAGDIFQVVPSQRFTADFDIPSFELYRSLRRLNPSPFLFHLNFKNFSLVGSSPEILVRVRDGNVTIRPIAGTRPRGENDNEDKTLAAELLNDEKETSEHLMLLDLARNDIGRISKTGSINITDKFFIEYYSHVMHIVSNVEGKLKDNTDSLDALFSGFPAGTVSGAPKVRAMEIIDELETTRRSFYGGCIGYLDGHGDVDTCITLRTALVKNGKIYMQAGGGVVADSDPESEYQESRNKAKAIIAAAELAIRNSQKKQKKTLKAS